MRIKKRSVVSTENTLSYTHNNTISCNCFDLLLSLITTVDITFSIHHVKYLLIRNLNLNSVCRMREL